MMPPIINTVLRFRFNFFASLYLYTDSPGESLRLAINTFSPAISQSPMTQQRVKHLALVNCKTNS